MEAVEDIWDVDEPDRIANLALRFPELLTHEEQILWKMICTNGAVWRGWYQDYNHGNTEWRWKIDNESLDRVFLREHWDTFKQVANGTLDKSALPTWQKTGTPTSPSSDGSDPGDDIPF
ncbi:MAG: hypothetical protein HQL50_08660 [Magnetococcales bacterium]|nr:hypothetical protein [Magnetococcales bacterium]